jgi:hypothetical protein
MSAPRLSTREVADTLTRLLLPDRGTDRLRGGYVSNVELLDESRAPVGMLDPVALRVVVTVPTSTPQVFYVWVGSSV